MQCPRCQQENRHGAKFCGECGTPLQHSPVDVTSDRPPVSRLLSEVPLSPHDAEDEAVETTHHLQHQRSGTLIPKLLGVLSGMMLAPSVDRPARTKSMSPRDADRLGPRPRETSHLSEVTGAASREQGTTSKEASTSRRRSSAPPRGASTPVNETGAPTKKGINQSTRGSPPTFSATVQPSASAPAPFNEVARVPSPEPATPKSTQQFGGSHAELMREPVSRGWGDSYTVRLVDSAGEPLVVGEVFLVAYMADGTVENIALGARPEPGTYRGTVPTGRSTPVDLRVRVSTGDKFVEVPMRP